MSKQARDKIYSQMIGYTSALKRLTEEVVSNRKRMMRTKDDYPSCVDIHIRNLLDYLLRQYKSKYGTAYLSRYLGIDQSIWPDDLGFNLFVMVRAVLEDLSRTHIASWLQMDCIQEETWLVIKLRCDDCLALLDETINPQLFVPVQQTAQKLSGYFYFKQSNTFSCDFKIILPL